MSKWLFCSYLIAGSYFSNLFVSDWSTAFADYSGYPVTKELTSPKYITDFRNEICDGESATFKKWPKAKRDSCNDQYQKTFLAKLAEVYPNAEWHKIAAWCTANPLDCNKMQNIEAKARESSTSIQSQQQAQRDAQLDQQKSDRRKRILHAIAAGLKGVSQGMQSNDDSPSTINPVPLRMPVSCTTNHFGATSSTNCN